MTFDPVVVAPNARLLAIRPPAAGDGYGVDGAAAAARWAGDVEARADDQRRTHNTGDDVDRVTETELRFDGRSVPATVELGDVVTYSAAGVSFTRAVRRIHLADVGLTTLTFWDA